MQRRKRECADVGVWISNLRRCWLGGWESSCLVTALYDAIHTCCDEKFKLPTTELLAGTSAWDMDVLWDAEGRELSGVHWKKHSNTHTEREYRHHTFACAWWIMLPQLRIYFRAHSRVYMQPNNDNAEGKAMFWASPSFICALQLATNWDDVPLMFQIHFCSCSKHDWRCILHEAAFGGITSPPPPPFFFLCWGCMYHYWWHHYMIHLGFWLHCFHLCVLYSTLYSKQHFKKKIPPVLI